MAGDWRQLKKKLSLSIAQYSHLPSPIDNVLFPITGIRTMLASVLVHLLSADCCYLHFFNYK